MGFLKVYNCLPGLPQRLSPHLIDDWNRYHTLKLPKLRFVFRYSFYLITGNMYSSYVFLL